MAEVYWAGEEAEPGSPADSVAKMLGLCGSNLLTFGTVN